MADATTTAPAPRQLTDIEYYPLGRRVRSSVSAQITRVGDRQIVCKTAQGWPFVIDRDRITAVNRDDPDHQLNEWCPVTTIIDCRERSCELHYMAAPLRLADSAEIIL